MPMNSLQATLLTSIQVCEDGELQGPVTP